MPRMLVSDKIARIMVAAFGRERRARLSLEEGVVEINSAKRKFVSRPALKDRRGPSIATFLVLSRILGAGSPGADSPWLSEFRAGAGQSMIPPAGTRVEWGPFKGGFIQNCAISKR
jgi:hypothetical protein